MYISILTALEDIAEDWVVSLFNLYNQALFMCVLWSSRQASIQYMKTVHSVGIKIMNKKKNLYKLEMQ